MTIESTVVHVVVVRYVLNEVEPLEKLHEPLILLYYSREQFEAKEWDWIVILKDELE
jgi:hypothetical protein